LAARPSWSSRGRNLAGDGARVGTVKLPRALLPRRNPWPTYTPPPPLSRSSSPLHTPLPCSHRRRGKLRCQRGCGVPRASSPSPRCGSTSRQRGSLAETGESVFFLLFFSSEVLVDLSGRVLPRPDLLPPLHLHLLRASCAPPLKRPVITGD
jgi:hypothetical protein